jgi:hypothetical protein
MERLGSIDPARVAAPLGVVNVDVGHTGVGKHLGNEWLDVRPIDKIRVEHHACGIIGSQRKRAPAHDLRHLIPLVIRLGCPFAHEDGVRRAVRRVGGLAGVIEQKQRFT